MNQRHRIWLQVLVAVVLGVTAALIAIRRGHPALMAMALTATVVLFNGHHADLSGMADRRLQASAIGSASLWR